VASTCGIISAAAAPCTARAVTSSAPERARPHHSDAAVNPSNPSRNTGFDPRMSPSRPPVTISVAKAI
jgi:hypothetical protein